MSSTGRKTRRHFLGSTLGTVAGSLGGPLIVPASALGRGRATSPGDRIAIGLIGSGGRGVYESRSYVGFDDCELVAVCDPREDRRTKAKQLFEKLYAERKPNYQGGIRMYNDFRELLSRKDIDAVYIATPDHWHVPITIAALKAGKDCHTEKPLGLNIEQDLAALKAVRKYRRIFQYGAERRSTQEARHAVELVLNGRIGKVQKIYVVSPGSEIGGSATPVLPVPKGWDYDMWLGPAPEAPFCYDRCVAEKNKGVFHIRDYAIGFIAGWAAHPLDQLQCWADHSDMGIPITYEGKGKVPTQGLFNCSYQWDLRCTYPNGLVMYFMDTETYKNAADAPHPDLGRQGIPYVHNAAIFVGTEGWVAIAYENVLTHPASLLTSEIGPHEIHLRQSRLSDQPARKGVPPGIVPHHRDWIDSVRSRKDPVDPIESAVSSDLVSQLSDLCIRTGRTVRWDPVKKTIVGNDTARKMMSQPMRKPWKLS